MKRAASRFLALLSLAILVLMAFGPMAAAAAAKNVVYVVHVDEFQEIDPAMARLTERIFAEAANDPNAVGVAIVIDTPGGYVTSAMEMKRAIMGSKLKTVAWVQDRAWSAGALVALSAEKLYMNQGSSIGAAEPRVAGTTVTADYKTLSALASEFESTALARGRDPKIAAAMVDKNTPLPDQRRELLTLNYQEALDKKLADGQAATLKEALTAAGIGDYELKEVPWTLSDKLGRFLTQPWVAALLLVVGVIAIGIEFMKPGVTLPGLVGVVCIALFFIGNVLVGTAGFLELGLAFLGIILLIIEAFVPGHGIFGVTGIISMATSVFLSVPSTALALRYLLITALGFLVALVGIIQRISRRGLGKALTLEKDARGYVPPRADLQNLLGKEGRTLTVLRPAGTAQFGDQKLDVVAEGEFVAARVTVQVIRVEGTRVVVRPVDR